MKYFFPRLLLASIVGLIAASPAFGTATIVILNADLPNVGFNDPTVVAPVGGNAGTTVGEQRLIAFQAAANIWGATLVSGPTITIRASWPDNLTCSADSGTLGSAGNSGSIWRDFPGATFPGTWYGNALANALRNTDSNGADPEINARFNIKVGTPGCLEDLDWYYGLDGNEGPVGVDLVAVVLHEFGHGLGFQTFTSSSTGARAGDAMNGFFPSIYDRFLLDNTTGEKWSDAGMTDAERQASAINTGNLVWNGTQVTADATFLATGKDAQGHPLMHAPNPIATGSSVSHWESNGAHALLMEPNISRLLGHGVTVADNPQDLTFSLMRDIGWCAGCPQPPPPSPTPTPSPPPNDNFVNAQVLSGCSGSVNGTNVAATKETGAGEPSNPVSPGSTKSVWYQWQAPSTGSATIDTIGSGYDTILAVYTGTTVGGLTHIASNDDIASGNTASTVTFSATAGTTYRITVNGFENTPGSGGDAGNFTLNWTESPCSAASPTLQFSASAFSVGEGDGQATITITRAGSTSGAASVNYATSDTAGLQACTVRNSGNASERCDYATIVGTATFGNGDASKTFTIPIVDDIWPESPAEVFGLTLSSPTGASLGSQSTATVTISDNGNDGSGGQNPFDDPAFFIRQLYIDFLGRLPDSNGFQDWFATLAGGIDSAGNSHPPCPNGGFGEPPSSNCDRLHVAAGFFLSDEFLNRGYFAFRFYMVSFNQRPTYAQFIPDMAQVGGPKSPAEENASKTAYADAFVQRPAFTSAYPGLSGQALANALLQTAGLPAGSYNAGAQTNGQILRGIAESNAASNKFFNEGIVSIQYFGFLRRDPDTIGYNNNLAALNADPNNLRHMIFIFIYSDEYRFRFGP